MKPGRYTSGAAIILIPVAAVLAFLGYCWQAAHEHGDLSAADFWQPAARPGMLSEAHAHLENNCNACHTPIAGVTVANCIVCHANDAALLQRQPTAFHANIGTCSACHLEHQGRAHRPTKMAHDALAKIGLRQLAANPDPASEDRAASRRLEDWISRGGTTGSGETARERVLNCAECHGNDDRHFGLFGNDCAACHGTAAWTVPEFRHPQANSLDCAQCHQAPPSHYMMHFKMISQKVAGQPHARVEQCHLCHQTTAWPDIRGAGWYKHH